MSEYIEIGTHKVLVNKRKGQKHIRLRVNSDGNAVLSTPKRYPTFLVKDFLSNKGAWLDKHTFSSNIVHDGSVLHSGETVQIKLSNNRNKTKTNDHEMIFHLKHPVDSDDSQKYIKKHISKHYVGILGDILEDRLNHYSELTGFGYKSLKIGHFKSKWGSCDNKKNIKLSLYLIGVDAYLRDYVVLHELVHTKHMNHSENFWKTMGEFMPDYNDRKKVLKTQKMTLLANVEKNM